MENATLDTEIGKYVIEPVSADIDVKAVFALVIPVDFDFTTGIGGIESGCDYRITSKGTYLVIEGVAKDDNIRIYTVDGTLMADKVVPADADTVSMSLAEGIYIVAINGTTIKVRH